MPNGNTAANNIETAFTNTCAESASTPSATPKITATSEDRIIKSTMASSSTSSSSGSNTTCIDNDNKRRKFRDNDEEEHKERRDCSFFDEYENQATHLTVEHNGKDEGRNGDDEMEHITYYRDTDVLCGSGMNKLANNHFGNISYRKQVDLKKALYQKGSNFAKVNISKSIVATIRKQNGRFLEKHEVNAAAAASTTIINTKKQAKKKDDDDKNLDDWMIQCCLPQSAIGFLTHSDDDDDDDTTTTYNICRTIRTAEDFLTASSIALVTAYIDYRHHYTANDGKISAITRTNASTQLSNWRAKVKTLARRTERWFDIGDARAIQKTSRALREGILRKRRQQQQSQTTKQQVGNSNQLQTTILCVGDDDELWTTIFADPPIDTNDSTATPSKQWIYQQQEMRDVVETDRPIASPKLEQQIQQQLRMELKSIELQQLQAEISFIANDDTATVIDTSTSQLGFCSPICILPSSSRMLKQGKSSSMTEERIRSLNELEFNWQVCKEQSAIKTATDTESETASSELESDINISTSLSSSSSFSPIFPAASSGTESVQFESITALGDFPISNEYDENKDNESQHSYHSDDENEDLYLII